MGTESGQKFKMETPVSEWGEARAKNITFILTEDCQLRCRYCYLVGKNTVNRMDFDIARQTLDYLIGEKELFSENSIILDFIGGEPFLEIDLIDRICDYFKLTTYKLEHKWFDNYRFSFSTNGLLYADKRVQRFIEKNARHLSIGISIDGTKNKHDLQRIYPDGSGSYDDVVKNIPLWLEQFPDGATKVTVSHDDLPFIRESVQHLWELGIKNININVVFENDWEEGDDAVFEEQLMQLADYIMENNLYEDHHCSFFSRYVGRQTLENQNWCGAGKMLAVDHTGNFYPCVRFTPFSLQNKKAIIIGNCYNGVDENKIRPFVSLDLITQSSMECRHCDVASGCAWCQGVNYDFADTNTIYQRATYICKMHKARVRANNYFWEQFDNKQKESRQEVN